MFACLLAWLRQQLERGYVHRPIRGWPYPSTSHTITLSFYCIMPLKLLHGDYVDDTDPWCPVCFNLSYASLESGWSQQEGMRWNKASPEQQRKGTLRGWTLWWRARYDFQHRAEQHDCVFCAVLLQIVDRFWRQTKPRWSLRAELSYKLMVFENGSVEMEDWNGCHPYSPTRLVLFTPSGIKSLPVREYKLITKGRSALLQNSD